MSRKVQMEDKVLEYFQQQPLQRAELLLTIVTGVVKRRQPSQPVAKPGNKMSAAARKKLSDAAKERWAKQRQQQTAEVKAAAAAD